MNVSVHASDENSISKSIRRNIFDGLILNKVRWNGDLSDADFLGRIFDLEKMPSTDGRFSDALGDIWQHTENNDDWDWDWVYSDSRFDLLTCEDQKFLQFLEEMIHPVVRCDEDEAIKLSNHFNDQLKRVGWEMKVADRIGGCPVFKASRLAFDGSFMSARKSADILDANWMRQEIVRAEKAIESDPDLAIGTAKEMIETCCKTILARLPDVKVPKNIKYPALVKLTVKALKLTRDDIPDAAKGAEVVKNLLSNLTSVTEGMNELRNLYGTGHGRKGSHKGLEARHARLAVTSAIAFVVFVSETFEYRKY